MRAAEAPHKFAIYTVERSMPPVIIARESPIAISPYSVSCLPIVWKFNTLMNAEPRVIPAKIRSAARIISIRIKSLFFLMS